MSEKIVKTGSLFCPKAHQNIYNCQRLLRGGIKCYTWSVANPQNLASDQEFWWCSVKKYGNLNFANCLNINFKLKLWNIINSIRGSDWYITIMVWKIYNGKIEVISFKYFTAWAWSLYSDILYSHRLLSTKLSSQIVLKNGLIFFTKFIGRYQHLVYNNSSIKERYGWPGPSYKFR
jgi:hypothetical protein